MADNISLCKFYYWNSCLGQLLDTGKLLDIYWSNFVFSDWFSNSKAQTRLCVVCSYRPATWYLSLIHIYIGVITAVPTVQMRYFKSLDRVVKATWDLVSLSKKVIYNIDFSELKELATNTNNSISYGIDSGKVRFTDIQRDNNHNLVGRLSIGSQSVQVKTNFVACLLYTSRCV